MTAHAVVAVAEGQLAVALFLRYDNPAAGAIWASVSIGRRRAVPAMLRQAVDVLAIRSHVVGVRVNTVGQ